MSSSREPTACCGGLASDARYVHKLTDWICFILLVFVFKEKKERKNTSSVVDFNKNAFVLIKAASAVVLITDIVVVVLDVFSVLFNFFFLSLIFQEDDVSCISSQENRF